MLIMKPTIDLNLENPQATILVCKAFTSEVRIDILKLLMEAPLNVSEIAEHFLLPMSSAALHIKILEEAGLITVTPKPGLRGSQKLCGIKVSHITLDLFAHLKNHSPIPPIIHSIPIGHFSDCLIAPPCGIATKSSYLECEDSPYVFYSSERNDASLIWFSEGYLEYKFSTKDIVDHLPKSIEISFEICSEAPGYSNEWPSDISLFINNYPIVTFLSPGDFGDRRGTLNPVWWGNTLTQYGLLKKLTITTEGCYLDNKQVSSHTLESLRLQENYFICFKLAVEPHAHHKGGLNLFGKNFGDHPQDILVKFLF